MPRVCTVCTHPEREAIDRALVEGAVGLNLASRFELSKSAVDRHKADHLPAALVKGREAREVANADDLLQAVQDLQARAWSILSTAEDAGDLRTALGAIREARGNLELLAKLMGKLHEGAVVNVLVSPEWIMVRTLILQALDPYPDARLAVSGAMEAHAGA
jgi:hypothetical protein